MIMEVGFIQVYTYIAWKHNYYWYISESVAFIEDLWYK